MSELRRLALKRVEDGWLSAEEYATLLSLRTESDANEAEYERILRERREADDPRASARMALFRRVAEAF